MVGSLEGVLVLLVFGEGGDPGGEDVDFVVWVGVVVLFGWCVVESSLCVLLWDGGDVVGELCVDGVLV